MVIFCPSCGDHRLTAGIAIMKKSYEVCWCRICGYVFRFGLPSARELSEVSRRLNLAVEDGHVITDDDCGFGG